MTDLFNFKNLISYEEFNDFLRKVSNYLKASKSRSFQDLKIQCSDVMGNTNIEKVFIISLIDAMLKVNETFVTLMFNHLSKENPALDKEELGDYLKERFQRLSSVKEGQKIADTELNLIAKGIDTFIEDYFN